MSAVALRLIILPVLAFAFFVAYTHSLPIAHSLLPTVSDVGIGLFIVSVGALDACLAVMWAVVFALPFAWLYRRHAALAAVLCVAPILIVTWTVAIGRPPKSALAWLPAAFSIVTLVVIVPSFAHIAHRVLRRDAAQPG